MATLGHGAPNPSWIPAGNTAVRLLAEEIGGVPGGSISEVFGAPVTAHILGGAVIGDSPERGVVDAYHRVFGHPGLHVVDGAAVSANLGREPVADHRRAGRAGDGVLAQQGRARPAAAAGRGLPAARARSPRGAPSCRPARRGRCASSVTES